MVFRFEVLLSEGDYLAFNRFHSFSTREGRRMLWRHRGLFLLMMAGVVGLTFLLLGKSLFSFCYTALLVVFSGIYLVLLRKRMDLYLRGQMKRLKKGGKLPFDPVATLEFYEDKMVEITPTTRTEQSYAAIERVCVDGDRCVYLYNSSVTAIILPIPQIRPQANLEDFLQFLRGKCPRVEKY